MAKIPRSQARANSSKGLASTNTSGTTSNARIYGEANVTPATFSTGTDYAARTSTTAYTTWSSIGARTDSVRYDTVDISAVVQEIFGLPGWASGHNMIFFINDNGSSTEAYRLRLSAECSFSSTLAIDLLSLDLLQETPQNDSIFLWKTLNRELITVTFRLSRD